MNESNYWHAVNEFASMDKRFRGAKDVGWVYAFRNPNHRKLMFKIGETSRPPFQRLQELSRETGVPIPYQAVYFVAVLDRRRAERFVHDQLDEYRVSRSKEFFTAPLKRVIQAMDLSIQYFGNPFQPQAFEAEIVSCSSCSSNNRVKRVGITVRIKCSTCGDYLSV